MKYIVMIVQPDDGGYDNEVGFQFDTVEMACSFMGDVYESSLDFEKKTHMELIPYDDVKARQEELLDGITEDMEEGFREAMLRAEEEEDDD